MTMLVTGVCLAALAGYRFLGAVWRWQTTIKVLGLRSTIEGIAIMARVRSRRPLRLASGHEIPLSPIHPNVPLLFELQVVAFALLLVLWSSGRQALFTVLRSPIMPLAAIWCLSRASESILPPCLLYLGVSEPGQFENVRYLASSRAWLTVSAIDQSNPWVNQGESASGPLGLLGVLLPDALQRFLLLDRLRAIPFQRRRLESIRTHDDLWEPLVRSLIAFVPVIIADLRSPSKIVGEEFVWVLEAQTTGRSLVVTRPDGTTSMSRLLDRHGVDLRSIGHPVTQEQLNVTVAEIVDGAVRKRPSCIRPPLAPEHLGRLCEAIRHEAVQAQKLLSEIPLSNGPSAAIDAAIYEWAEGVSAKGPAPAYTASLPLAVRLLRQRLDKCSYTLHIGGDGSAWVDLAVQSIAQSYRVSLSMTERPLDSPEKALLLALLNAEAGGAWARTSIPRTTVYPLADSWGDDARSVQSLLLQSFPFLHGAQTVNGWYDLAAQQKLAAYFKIPPETFLADDENTMTVELQGVIDALQGRGDFVPQGGPYSLSIDVSINGRGLAEVAQQQSQGWFIALSSDLHQDVWLRPGVALMIAAIKAEHLVFDFAKR